MTVAVLFVQGAGDGAHEEDAALAASLAHHLGAAFEVRFPQMPTAEGADSDEWAAVIAHEIEAMNGRIVLVGHSAGGYELARFLTRAPLGRPFVAICLVAAPFPGADPDWTFDGFDLPDNLASRMPAGASIFLYASPDDDIVPFAHRDAYAAALPRAITRTVTGGHQLGNDLAIVAADIRAAADD